MLGRKRTFEEACEDQKQTEQQIEQQTAPPTPQQPTFSKQLLQIYYDRLFPYEQMFNWLSYFNDPSNTDHNRKFWCNREWSFTLKDDIYVRYKSYKTAKDFKDDLRKKCPYKIDIGALYNIEPSRRRTVPSDKFIAEEKELVFDIDISDYDDVRNCCKEAGICNQCWPLMCCAIEVLNSALRQDFGLKHLLWVFSGRRGIHCWVSDDVTRVFDVHGRSAILDYLKLYSGNSMNNIKVDLEIEKTRNIHASLVRAYAICLKYFKQCSLSVQGVLDSEKGINYFCEMIRFGDLRVEMRRKLMDLIDCEDYDLKWKEINAVFESFMNKVSKSNNSNDIRNSKKGIRANRMEIVFSYVYPRLDVEVSRHVNHLLKSPFCIHPKTGKVCSIIDPEKCEEFDVVKQPTLIGLIEQYNKHGRENDGTNSKAGWKDTDLKECVSVFKRTFLNGLQEERLKMRRVQQANSMEF